MCKIRPDGTFDEERCHSVIDLDDFGITGLSGKGCIADEEWLRTIVVPCHVSEDSSNCILCLPNRRVHDMMIIDQGKYGYIKGARREVDGRVDGVVLKQPKEPGTSLLSEALIQKVVYESLLRGGFHRGAAPVYDIIRLRDGTVCFTMERMYGKTLQELIETRIGFKLVNLIMECLIQVSSMLWHLENDIGMNHRDLKPSNIILHAHEPCDKTAVVAGMPITFLSHFDVSFIDFGFSCVGIDGGRGGGNLRAGAGRGYVPEDPCPKDGRDMYMFMAFLYYYTYRKLPVDLERMFEQWLNVEACKMTDYLRVPANYLDPQELLAWIYRLTGNPLVQRFKTNPERIFSDLLQMTG